MTTTNTNSVRFHRVLRATPERVYRAFLDPDAMVKWLPPNGFTGKVHQMDARVGGTHRMSFTNFTTGKSHSFGGTYVELTPHERIRYTDKFDSPGTALEAQRKPTSWQIAPSASNPFNHGWARITQIKSRIASQPIDSAEKLALTRLSSTVNQ